MLLCRPRCCLVDRLKAVAYGVEVVALQLAQVTAHTKPGYGKLQFALRAPNVVDIHVSEYGAVILDRDEAKVAGFFVLYLDAELILVGANELHFARPLVCKRGYGITIPSPPCMNR